MTSYQDPGYDAGYMQCEEFWGTQPAALVRLALEMSLKCKAHPCIIDLGCGQGKNAIYCAQSGAQVIGVDSSIPAIERCRLKSDLVTWVRADIRTYPASLRDYDIVISTGAIHCFISLEEIRTFVHKLTTTMQPGSLLVLSSFNSGSQDMSGHSDLFKPIFPSHQFLSSLLSQYDIIQSSDGIQVDVHPNNNIEHHHSISRFLVRM